MKTVRNPAWQFCAGRRAKPRSDLGAADRFVACYCATQILQSRPGSIRMTFIGTGKVLFNRRAVSILTTLAMGRSRPVAGVFVCTGDCDAAAGSEEDCSGV